MQEFSTIDDETISMYDTEDYEVVNPKPTNNIVIKKDQFTTEVKIGDQTLRVISPEYVAFMNKSLAELTARCNALENELRGVKQESRRKDSYFNRVIDQINSRLGFNG